MTKKEFVRAVTNLRIQIQTDPRYQEFIANATTRDVLGYQLKVATVEDVLKGKVWAYSDKQRRMSKQQKDLADMEKISCHADYNQGRNPIYQH